ncbi:hypothetical protein INR49_019477, partial [Caranx melampygus]
VPEGEYTVEVSINDYLDIYCPHYEGAEPAERMEHYILYMVNYDGYTTCDHRRRGFKRWECNRPQTSPHPNLADDSVYESPEPFLTDDTTGGCSLALPHLSLLFIMSLALLLLASS